MSDYEITGINFLVTRNDHAPVLTGLEPVTFRYYNGQRTNYYIITTYTMNR